MWGRGRGGAGGEVVEAVGRRNIGQFKEGSWFVRCWSISNAWQGDAISN